MPNAHSMRWILPCVAMLAVAGAVAASAAPDPTAPVGPYNNRFLEGGIGLERTLVDTAPPLAASAPWSITGWLRSDGLQHGNVIVLALGSVDADAWRGLFLADGRPALRISSAAPLVGPAALDASRWYSISATYDGALARLYVDGREVAAGPARSERVGSRVQIAPSLVINGSRQHFGGLVADLRVSGEALSPGAVTALATARPNFDVVTFNATGVGWPWQEHAWRGLLEPQEPRTLPHSKSPPSTPVAEPEPPATAALTAEASNRWSVDGWRLAVASTLGADADGVRLSKPGYDSAKWYAAVVPGTVLTTLIARGVYPDPDYGLNNMAIPESLSRQDYWYRTEFTVPNRAAGRNHTLTFNGINYAAEVWWNGTRLGAIKGAFTRGVFDLPAARIADGRNALAVHILPPPHPGIPHEQSVAAGPGENGGQLAIDGPTFIATEGWDWIPAIRDRNIGLWQGVELRATGALKLLDPHVVTQLPLPKIDSADVSITVAIENRSAAPTAATISARFDDVEVRKVVTLQPGVSELALDSREFPQLHLPHPRLWWPNGYGPANLYALTLAVSDAQGISDTASLRFGVRELTYELSLFDSRGRLRRVEVDPTAGSARGERLVDVRHEAIKRTPQGWAESLTTAGENSPAVRPVATESLTPYLAIRVNGVPIAARGGSWGMDDSRKRVSRAHLEPFFELHRAAHLNIIRNWLGQDTEEVFYDLADEYGLLILNDFWVSTQDFQVEPQDPGLFLANARDVVSRFRNHPSIAVWFGRNEGVPQPILNEGLADLIATLDGTRYYTGSSNTVNLQGSGPYNYRPPEQYFTELARGFSVEVGTPSVSTLEALHASIPEADRWPLGDTYAYHDWHFGGNGDVASYMTAMQEQYGAPTSLEDFERKAQLMDYVSYRAIFEGFQAHLWTENSGRLLWMTHPSWPSNTWQIYSSDYDTAAPYYAVKKACEPIHAQLNLPDYRLAVVNTTREPQAGLTLRSRVVALDGRVLLERRDRVEAAANAVTTLAALGLAPILERERVVVVRLTLEDRYGARVSENSYWPGRDQPSQQRLNELAPQPVELSAVRASGSGATTVTVTLVNRGSAPVLNAKVTAFDAGGNRVLPVFYSDNYVTLLPHETKRLEIHCPAAANRCEKIALRGWDVVARETSVLSMETH